MTPEDLQTALARALATADAGLVAPGSTALIDVTAPTRPQFGDWSTPVALRAAAAPERRTELAAHLCTELRTLPEVADAVVAGPGFVNVSLTAAARTRAALDIAATASAPGQPVFAKGRTMRIDPGTVSVLQRGHAAACREQRRARRAGISTVEVDTGRLEHPSETRMLNSVSALRPALERSNRLGDIDPFLSALLELSEAVEDWLHRCAVTPTVDEDITVTHSSRLLVLRAVITVLAAGLRQLGASAPERI